ncbi:hypothetical protein VNO78_20299 [Psophocarpus tetragonolobus]|uniref:Uncharacterized protein n=1 Tax=Psophocarpus tetragonolobus TaxID=3891 RepID=A0AAN9SA39_PSOTE
MLLSSWSMLSTIDICNFSDGGVSPAEIERGSPVAFGTLKDMICGIRSFGPCVTSSEHVAEFGLGCREMNAPRNPNVVTAASRGTPKDKP